MLSDSESENGSSNNEHQLIINEHYAKAFQYRKEREELVRLKEKYGSDYGEDSEESVSDSESDELEDEDGEELTPAIDAAILRTLARIKRKDPEIYQSEKDIFTEEKDKIADTKLRTKPRGEKHKPITVKQVALEAALNPSSRSPSPQPVTFSDEQRALREETIAAFHGSGSDNENDDGDELLVPREKSKDELEREEEEYKDFLQRQVGADLGHLIIVDPDTIHLVNEEQEASLVGSDRQRGTNGKGKKRMKKANQEAEDQEFLMNYILNRGWVDRSSKRIPTYKEITGVEREEEPLEDGAEGTIDEDEEFEDMVDHFESTYNFRFEEPDADIIKAYPRNVTTVRREENPRKAARERKRQRKEEKLQQKKEEINRLKALKLKDLRVKLDKIAHEGGKEIDDAVLQELDLDGEWDPEKHDAQIASLYEGDDVNVDDEKPSWEDDIDIGDIGVSTAVETPSKKKKKKDDSAGVDDGVDVDAMDADNPNLNNDSDEEWDGTEEMRKRKVAQYMEGLYNLDFNDMVGDMPTRFNYISTQPQDYALTPAEILMATDAELNEYMGVKRFAPYRKDTKWDPKRTEKLKVLKRKLTERGAGADDTEQVKPAKKRKGKKERMKLKGGGHADSTAYDTSADRGNEPGDDIRDVAPTQKRRRQKKKATRS